MCWLTSNTPGETRASAVCLGYLPLPLEWILGNFFLKACFCFVFSVFFLFNTFLPQVFDVVLKSNSKEVLEMEFDSNIFMGFKSSQIMFQIRLSNFQFELFSSKCSSFKVYVDQVTDDVITVTRHNSMSHKSVIAAIRTAFDCNINFLDQDYIAHNHGVNCLNLPGTASQVYSTLQKKCHLNSCFWKSFRRFWLAQDSGCKVSTSFYWGGGGGVVLDFSFILLCRCFRRNWRDIIRGFHDCKQ